MDFGNHMQGNIRGISEISCVFIEGFRTITKKTPFRITGSKMVAGTFEYNAVIIMPVLEPGHIIPCIGNANEFCVFNDVSHMTLIGTLVLRLTE
jgi:hypothetical protein